MEAVKRPASRLGGSPNTRTIRCPLRDSRRRSKPEASVHVEFVAAVGVGCQSRCRCRSARFRHRLGPSIRGSPGVICGLIRARRGCQFGRGSRTHKASTVGSTYRPRNHSGTRRRPRRWKNLERPGLLLLPLSRFTVNALVPENDGSRARLAAIANRHATGGLETPTDHPLARWLLQRYARTRGTGQRRRSI